MRIFCIRLMATLTGHDRYMPDIVWSPNSYVHNIFRAWEYIFGKPYRVCHESAIDFWEDSHGKVHIQRRFYTVEAFLAHIEGTIRLSVKSLFTTVEYKRYAFATVCLFILGFELKISTTWFSSVFFINAIARDANSTSALSATPSANHTVTGSDTAMYIGTKGSAYTTSATYVNPATRIANNSTANTYFISLYSLKNPPVGTASLTVVPSSGTAGFTAESYTGCNQSVQPDVFNTGSITSTSLTTSVTTVTDNAWLIGYFSSAANTMTASTGTNFLIAQVNNVALGDSNGALSPIGSYSMSVTAASGDIVSIIASFGVPQTVLIIRTLLSYGVGI